MENHDYDYAQPVSYGAAASVGSQVAPIQLENPFNTDAEACVEFFWSTGTSGIVSIASDTAPSANLNNITGQGASNGAMGYTFPIPLISGFHSDFYFPVKQFLNLFASLTSASFVLTIVWRRPKETYIPSPHKLFNEPTA